MTDSNQELQTLKALALSENQKFVDDAETVTRHLRKGVSFAVACNIIDNYWGVASSKAKELKLKLNSTDWQENGRVILHTNIDKTDIFRMVGERKSVYEYFSAVQDYITDRIGIILADLQKADFTEEELNCYNAFRKEVVRYLDYINCYWYDVEPLLQKEDLTCWTQLGISTARSEEGDYLFFDSFKEELIREHQNFIENYVNLKNISDYYSLSSCEHFAIRLGNQIKLPYLFAQWLDKQVNKND